MLTLALSLYAGLVAPADHVRFIVTGDDRWNTKAPRPGLDENGVNVGGLGRIVKAVLAEKPDVFLVNGDLVGGADTDEAELSQFDTWKKAMDPIYDAGIKVLACRGNHEMHCPHPREVWEKAMSGKYANPGTGPDDETGRTFSFSYNNCLFVSLDEFKNETLGINQAWLDQTLATAHPPHVFAFAHKMAFFSGNHDDGLFTAPATRDAMVKSLANAGARAIFFGHDHLYDHSAVKLEGWDDSKAMHQFVIGTAGAPFVKGKELNTTDGAWTISRIKHQEAQLGYAVVDVDGPKVHIVYKSESAPGQFTMVDDWSYTLPAAQ